MDFNVLSYLKKINQNSSIKLDDLALEDLSIEVSYYLSGKDYNQYLIKKTCLRFFLIELNKKKKQFELNISDSGSDELSIIEERLKKLIGLKISQKYKNILKDLIIGLSYEEIRKKYNYNSKQLRNVIYYIKNTLKYKT